eukprot:CAMPEP_0113693354 /NCGR_PEP_ID=MMETSP0038_2-20120614/19614_1 /TAXON_ID=2898 /ORGANISM="Cryptomonas paramecium" /LENGTH=458 /DNA_ID=CAMNT_0000615409 /DNA_START=21 /DNA_END=1394 /DNA_ORIENTATION=- /assembly_acc=CAM_ASM_000170
MGAAPMCKQVSDLQKRIGKDPLPTVDFVDTFSKNPELIDIFKLQVKECLRQVRILNKKVSDGVDPNTQEMKDAVEALVRDLAAPIRISSPRGERSEPLPEHSILQKKGSIRIITEDEEKDLTVGEKGQDTIMVQRLVGRLNAGDYFGEIALLSKVPRQATVRACGPVTLLELGRESFMRLCGGLESLLNENLNRYCTEEIVAEETELQAIAAAAAAAKEEEDQSGDAAPKIVPRGRRGSVFAKAVVLEANWTPPVYEKTAEEEDRIRGYLAKTALLSHLDQDPQKMLLGAAKRFSFEAGKNIIEQGAEGDFYYILDSGSAEALQIYSDGTEKKVFEYKAGGSFGELALMHGGARLATVRTLEPCECWALDRDTFRKIMMSTGRQSLDERNKFLSKVSLLRELSIYDRFRISEALVIKELRDGEDIVREGDEGESFFIVQRGTCLVYRLLPARRGSQLT